jgi:hypothetical protein
MIAKLKLRNSAILRGITGVSEAIIYSSKPVQIMINPIHVERGIWLHVLFGLLISLLRTKPTYGAI